MVQKKKKTTKKKPGPRKAAALASVKKKPAVTKIGPVSTLPPAQKYPPATVVKPAVGVAERLAIVRFCLGTLFRWVRLTHKAPALLKRRDIVVKLRKAIQELDVGNISKAKALAAEAKLDLKDFLDKKIAAGRKDLASFKL